MATVVRMKNHPTITGISDVADVLIVDGAAGARVINWNDFRLALAAALAGAPTTYKLAPLGGDNRIPSQYLPAAVAGALTFKGGVDGGAVAATSTAAGDYYVVTVAGTSQSTTWAVGDLAIYKGSSGQWEKVAAGVKQVVEGGTGGTTAAVARANLGAAWVDDVIGQTAPRAPRGGLWFADDATYKLNGANPVNLGLGNFTIAMVVTYPDYTPTNPAQVWYSHSTGNNRAYVVLSSNGNWSIRFIDGAGTPVAYEMTPDVALVDGRTYMITIACDRTGNATLYVNGTTDRDANGSGVTVSIAGSSGVDVGSGNTNPWTGQSRTVGVTHAFRVWNRLLTAAEVLAMARTGLVEAADQHGSLSRYASDFSGGVDGWAASSGETVTGNVDSVGGEDDTLRIQSGAGTRATALRALGRTIRPGQRFKVSARVYRPSGNGTGTHANFRGGADITFGSAATAATADAWTTISFDGVSTATSNFSSIQVCLCTSGASVTVTAGDQIYVRDVKVEFPGLVMDLGCDVGIGTFLPDRSGNNLEGILNTSGFIHVVPRQEGEFVVRRVFGHAAISATAGTTKVMDLPPNVGILDMELDRESAFDASTTLDVGITGTAAKFASGVNVAATGKVWADSLSKVGESSTGWTSIYLKKNQATTQGSVVVRIRCAARGV